jgi:hypothetical protein
MFLQWKLDRIEQARGTWELIWFALHRGPLIFCLLLSLLLSMTASGEQKSLVFSGVFAMVWIGEAVVTMQIKLLGGNMYEISLFLGWAFIGMLTRTCPQFVLSVRMHHRLHAVSSRHCGDAQCTTASGYRQNTGVPCSDRLVIGSWGQYSRRVGGSQEPGWDCSVSSLRFLRRSRLLVFH